MMEPGHRPNIAVESFPVESTAYYAVQAPEGGGDADSPLVLALHGWGQNAKKMIRDLAPLAGHNILVAAPQAPHPFYLDVASGKVGFHWLTRYERDQAVADANALLARLLAVVAEKHAYDSRRVFVLGFSQGCSMAWRFCVSGAIAPAGMIACGADLPPDVAEKLRGHAGFPALLVHGTRDEIVPVEKLHAARESLAELGFAHTVHEFDGGHEIPAAIAEEIAAWIARH
jgi:predicted esterase